MTKAAWLCCLPQITRSTKVLLLVQRLAEIGIYRPYNASTSLAALPAAQTAAAAAGAAAGPAAPAGSKGHGAAAMVEGAEQVPAAFPVKGCLKGSSAAAAAASAAAGQQLQQDRAAAAPAVKAIVFSQFWMHVLLIAAELSARGVHHFVLKRDMPAREKQVAVREFTATRHPCCLVMDASGGGGVLPGDSSMQHPGCHHHNVPGLDS
jgi:hypothetical protein